MFSYQGSITLRDLDGQFITFQVNLDIPQGEIIVVKEARLDYEPNGLESVKPSEFDENQLRLVC